jgi:hypothetical protein
LALSNLQNLSLCLPLLGQGQITISILRGSLSNLLKKNLLCIKKHIEKPGNFGREIRKRIGE